MKIIIFIILFLFLYGLLARYLINKYNDPYYIDLFIGLPGCGKSSDIVKYAIKVNYNKTFYDRVYCNMENVAGTYFFDLPSLIEINKGRSSDDYIIPFKPNSVVCIDEAGYFINNRDFKNFSKFMQYLCRYVRHHKLYLRIYSQSVDTDKVIRDLSRRFYLLKKYLNCITLIKPISKDIDIGQDIDGNGKLVENYKFLSILDWRLTWLPRYFGLFDSHSVQSSNIVDNSVYNSYNTNISYAAKLHRYIFHSIKYFFINKFNIKPSFNISYNLYLFLRRVNYEY